MSSLCFVMRYQKLESLNIGEKRKTEIEIIKIKYMFNLLIKVYLNI